jgi:uncharacterized protein YcbX
MASIASLHLYPIKSCAGLTLQEARLGHAGLEHQGVGDREWMLVDADGGRFLTQRQAPRMALIRPALGDGVLRVEAPGQDALPVPLDGIEARRAERAVQVWTHECLAIDEGDEAAAWFSAFLGRPLRLVRFDPAHRRASNREWTGEIEALNRFSDGYPILLISQSSLADLNDRLMENGREALPMNRFRPNIVLDGVGPYEEDYMEALAGNGVRLKPVKPCPRCPIPSIEQTTGEFGPDPLDILSQYRDDERTGGVVFGQNMVVLEGQGQMLKVGQEFEPEWNF